MSRAATFDKFGWLKAMHSDAALTDRDFRLAVIIGVTYTRADGTGWAVELDALAALLPGGLSRRRLFDALNRLVNHGYLAESGRSGGGRGVTARRSFRLCKPTTPASGVSDDRDLWITPETPDSSVMGLPKPMTAASKTHDSSVRNPGHQRQGFADISPDQRAKILPTGTSSGNTSGGAAIADDPEPPRFCPEHPAGSPKKCPPCGNHRHAHDAWQTRQHDRSRAEGQARRDAIADCPDCDEFGHVDLGEAVANCRHPKLSPVADDEESA